jgi:hypothetical protein
LLHGRFMLFNSPHDSSGRTLIEESCEAIQLFRRANSVDLNTPVIVIPDPTGKTDLLGVFLNEPSESNTLHMAGYKPPPCRPTVAQPLYPPLPQVDALQGRLLQRSPDVAG